MMTFRTVMAPKMIGRREGKLGFLGSIGVRFMIWGEQAGEHFSLVEHPMSPRALAAPIAPPFAGGRVQLCASRASRRTARRRRGICRAG